MDQELKIPNKILAEVGLMEMEFPDATFGFQHVARWMREEASKNHRQFCVSLACRAGEVDCPEHKALMLIGT